MNEIKCPKCGTMFQIDEKDYDSIVKQIRDGEFNAEIKKREEELRKYTKSEIDSLKERLDFEKKSELSNKELEIERLKNQIRQSEIENKYALKEAVQEKENKIVNLESKIELSQKEYQLKEQNLIDIHAREIKAKEQEIELYKDMKLKLSTKMVGETLEQHCKVQYDEYLRPILKNAYFEKDNDAKTGSKGDFIYREKTEDGIEFISIMFEMKNESDQTATKHKNEDFFKELDKDRKEKKRIVNMLY